jgi:hypothetical protein
MDLESNNTSFPWHHLDVGFMIKCQNFLTICEKDDIILKPIRGFVNLEDAASSFRADACFEENIQREINRLRANNADFLADILEKTTKQLPLKHHNYLPGFSWHNWGKAIIFYTGFNHCSEKIRKKISELEFGFHCLLEARNDKEDTMIYLQDEPKSVEETYDISYVNNYFKEKYERIC